MPGEPLTALDDLEHEVRRQLRHGPPGIDPMASINQRDLDAKFAALRAALPPVAPDLDVETKQEFTSCERTHADGTTHYHPLRVKAAIDKWEDRRLQADKGGEG